MSVLVVASSHGRGLQPLLEEELPGMQVECIFKPGGCLEHMPSMLQGLEDHYFDHVILLIGTNDACGRDRQVRMPLGALIDEVRESMDYLQIMYPAARVYHGGLLPRVGAHEYNSLISEFEEGLARPVVRLSRHRFLEGDHIGHDGVHLTMRGKFILVESFLRKMGLHYFRWT